MQHYCIFSLKKLSESSYCCIQMEEVLMALKLKQKTYSQTLQRFKIISIDLNLVLDIKYVLKCYEKIK